MAIILILLIVFLTYGAPYVSAQEARPRFRINFKKLPPMNFKSKSAGIELSPAPDNTLRLKLRDRSNNVSALRIENNRASFESKSPDYSNLANLSLKDTERLWGSSHKYVPSITAFCPETEEKSLVKIEAVFADNRLKTYRAILPGCKPTEWTVLD